MISKYFYESMDVKKNFIEKNEQKLEEIINLIKKTFEEGNKLLIAGNGGSAADSQHWAAEFISRYKLERKSLPAIALSTDTSALTAIGNDYSFDKVFSRQVEGLGNTGDIFIGLSTSGNSKNILEAMKVAKEKGIICIGLLGKDGGLIKGLCDYSLIVESNDTPRIQETHLVIYHTICEEVEKRMF
ncbi:MAG: D-sedoheptulose 7-phosphate isomerase [Candidatus Gracilibacteria bacterium]|nr:D-sedoheptulose 7-phosphate isomerase [Candidatus Gracilibacteria bacterium]